VSHSSQARCNAWLWSLPQSSGIHYLTPWVSVHPSDVHSLLLLKQLHKSGTRLALIVALLAMSSVTTTVVSLATTRQYNNATTPALHTAGADPLSGQGGASPPISIAFSGDRHRTTGDSCEPQQPFLCRSYERHESNLCYRPSLGRRSYLHLRGGNASASIFCLQGRP
jgi:hypothetical protein